MTTTEFTSCKESRLAIGRHCARQISIARASSAAPRPSTPIRLSHRVYLPPSIRIPPSVRQYTNFHDDERATSDVSRWKLRQTMVSRPLAARLYIAVYGLAGEPVEREPNFRQLGEESSESHGPPRGPSAIYRLIDIAYVHTNNYDNPLPVSACSFYLLFSFSFSSFCSFFFLGPVLFILTAAKSPSPLPSRFPLARSEFLFSSFFSFFLRLFSFDLSFSFVCSLPRWRFSRSLARGSLLPVSVSPSKTVGDSPPTFRQRNKEKKQLAMLCYGAEG